MSALITGLAQGSIYALFALGLALMFSVMRLINFAHGDVLTWAMYVVTFLTGMGLSLNASAPVTLLVMGVAGAVLYLVLFAPTLRAEQPALAQIFATVGLSIILQNGILAVFGADTHTVQPPISGSITIGSAVLSWTRVVPIIVLMAVLAVSWYLFQKTRFGMRVRAVAEDRTAARLVGLDVDRIYLQVTAISFAMVGVAGVVLAPLFIISPTFGFSLLLIAFMAVVIGGMGSIIGAVVGGLLLGIIESVTAFYISPLWAPGFMYLVFLGVLIVRPHGLLGDPSWSIE